jgi:hypothetical protein
MVFSYEETLHHNEVFELDMEDDVSYNEIHFDRLHKVVDMMRFGYYLTQHRVKVSTADYMDVKEELCKKLSDCTYCDPQWVDFKDRTLGGMMMRDICFAANKEEHPPMDKMYHFKHGGRKH